MLRGLFITGTDTDVGKTAVSPGFTIGYLEQLKGWQVGWRSYTQSFLDTGNEMVNGIVLSVLAAVAQQERLTISERTLAGLKRQRHALSQEVREAETR